MRGRQADKRSSEDAPDGVRAQGGGPVSVLVAGIPTRPGDLDLYVAESRPYESEVAKAIAALPSSGIRVSVVTDNMIAALIETVPIREVWTQYVDNDGECATAINGAHMAALLARAYEIPCLMFPISDLSTGRTGLFAGEDIRVQGASTIAWEPDIVPLDLVTEVIEP
jgi:methylthioribose-1-phosphate isomerase